MVCNVQDKGKNEHELILGGRVSGLQRNIINATNGVSDAW